MKLNRRILLVLLAVAFVVGLTTLLWHGPREPTYQGISLSTWLRADSLVGSMPLGRHTGDAVRHIGTNALPFLVNWIEDYRNPPPWKGRFLRRLLPYTFKPGSPGRDMLLEAIAKRELRARRALWGFEILGEAARPAIPDLVRVANQGNPETSPLATIALAQLGKDGLPPLLSLMTNSRSPLGKQATMSAIRSVVQMQDLSANTNAGVAVLIQYLSDSRLAPSAAEVLGMLALESHLSVPALAECTHSPNQDLRMAAAISLGTFGSSARTAVPELLKMLNDPSLGVRSEATNALQKIAADAGPP